MCDYPTSYFPVCQGSVLNYKKQCPPLVQGELKGRERWKGARKAIGAFPGETSPPTTTVILRIVTDRLEMFLETSMLTDLNRNKVLTQPISFGLTCMTHSLMSHALDGFTFLMCVNSEFEVLPPTLTKTMRFIPVRV